jgi:hypothetical protein
MKEFNSLRIEAFTAARVYIEVSWIMTSFSLVGGYNYFERTYYKMEETVPSKR